MIFWDWPEVCAWISSIDDTKPYTKLFKQFNINGQDLRLMDAEMFQVLADCGNMGMNMETAQRLEERVHTLDIQTEYELNYQAHIITLLHGWSVFFFVLLTRQKEKMFLLFDRGTSTRPRNKNSKDVEEVF